MSTERPAPQPGERRRLVGLASRSDLNGCIVTILNDERNGDRIAVRTDGTNENIRVRPECLAPLLAATTDSQTAVLYLWVHSRLGADPRRKFLRLVGRLPFSSSRACSGMRKGPSASSAAGRIGVYFAVTRSCRLHRTRVDQR